MLGWIGNVLLITGYISAGYKYYFSWHLVFLGCIVWLIYAWQLQMPSMIFIEIVCAIIAARNIYLWGKDDKT